MIKNSIVRRKYKGRYTLKEVYKRLLTEAILTTPEFLERIVSIAESKPSVSGKYGSIIKKILDKTKETKLLSLKGKENKKARKSAEFEIAKSLQDIKGIDGNPIDLKGMRPLYDSLAKYLENNVDVNIDDCLKSADYYMREFYRSADQEDVELIVRGKFNFETVFKRTNFYQSLSEYKTELSGINTTSLDCFDVYESSDKKIKIVYPLSSPAFNHYIKLNNVGFEDLSWCTQGKNTWLTYNYKQYVMIMTVDSANEEERLISLKVDKSSGEIDRQGTCDADNDHMGRRLDHLLSKELLDSVKSATISLSQKIKSKEVELVDEKETRRRQSKAEVRNKEVLKGLIELNKYSDIIDILTYMIIKYDEGIENEYTFENLVGILNYEARTNTQKKDNIVNAYIDFTASAYSDINIDLNIYSYLDFFDNDIITMDLFYKRLIEKSLNQRSHEKYFMTLIDCVVNENAFNKKVNIEDYAASFGDPKEVLETCLLNALNTNNILFFKSILKSSLKSEYFKENIINESFGNLLKTKGFSNLIDARRENIFNIENKDEVDLYLQETIFQEQNKIIMSDILQEKQIDVKAVDLCNFIHLIERFNSTRDEKHLSKESINRHLISQNSEDYNNIIEKITSDLSYFNEIFSLSNQDNFDIIIFKLFIAAKDSQNLIKYDERSYAIFNHIVNQRNEEELYLAVKSSNPDSILDLIEVIMQNFKKSKEELSVKLANTILKGLKILIPVIFRNQRVNERYTSHEENFKKIIEIADVNNDYLSLLNDIVDYLPLDKYPSNYSGKLSKDLFGEKMFKESIKILKENDVDQLSKNSSYFKLGYYLTKNNKVSDINIIEKIFKVYFKVLSYPKIFSILHYTFLDIVIPHFKDKHKLSAFIRDNFEITDHNEKMFFKIIEEFNKLKIAFDKENLGKFMSDDRFRRLDKDVRLHLYENLITISSDGHANHLDLIDDINKVKSILAYNLKGISKSSGGFKRKTYNFVNDLEDIINFISRLRSASRKRLAQAIPQGKTVKRLWQQQPHDLDDYFESLLKQYLKLIIR